MGHHGVHYGASLRVARTSIVSGKMVIWKWLGAFGRMTKRVLQAERGNIPEGCRFTAKLSGGVSGINTNQHYT